MPDDAELLRFYVEEKSEAAFADLVRRHLDLVHSAALRQVGGDAHRAQDVTQSVFVLLAARAGSLARHPLLTGWLYLTAQQTAARVMRAEWRRQARERAAEMLHATAASSEEVEWDRLRPVLDAAMRKLGDADREAVLLRFFARRPFADIGATLQLGEDGARKRVHRALDKLRVELKRRGITSTAAALGLALEANAVVAAPAGLAGSVTSAALTSAMPVGGALGLRGFMSSSKFAPALAGVAALVSVGAALFLENESRAATTALAVAKQENTAASARLAALTRAARDEAQAVAELQRVVDETRGAAASPLPAPAQARAPEWAAREFLAAHPEARRMIDAMREQSFELLYGSALREVDLAPEERARIAREVAGLMPFSGTFGALRFSENQSGGEAMSAEFARIEELLGNARFQRYLEARRWEEVHGLVTGVATTFHGSDTPLGPEQARAVVEIIKRHSNNAGDGRRRQGVAINWPAVARELEPRVTPAQLAAFTAAHASALGERRIFPFHGTIAPTLGAAK